MHLHRASPTASSDPRPAQPRSRRQLSIAVPCGWGGKRKGAGRKPVGERAGVPHRRREEPSAATRGAVHITLRVVDAVGNLRSLRNRRALWRAFAAGKDRFGFRLCHFALLRNHIHLLCEVEDREALLRGMRALAVRIARQLNKVQGRSGRVLADRYHVCVLKSLRQLRHALCYVVNNYRRHMRQHGGWALPPTHIDLCCSGWYFDGYAGERERPPDEVRALPQPVVLPRYYPLRTGWRRHGLIAVDELPGTKRGSGRPKR